MQSPVPRFLPGSWEHVRVPARDAILGYWRSIRQGTQQDTPPAPATSRTFLTKIVDSSHVSYSPCPSSRPLCSVSPAPTPPTPYPPSPFWCRGFPVSAHPSAVWPALSKDLPVPPNFSDMAVDNAEWDTPPYPKQLQLGSRTPSGRGFGVGGGSGGGGGGGGVVAGNSNRSSLGRRGSGAGFVAEKIGITRIPDRAWTIALDYLELGEASSNGVPAPLPSHEAGAGGGGGGCLV